MPITFGPWQESQTPVVCLRPATPIVIELPMTEERRRELEALGWKVMD